MSRSLRVVVIGSGAIGVSIAADLAERGTQVTLIDAGSPGLGTSSSTFGWLNSNGKEPHPYFEINRLGLEAHHRLARTGGSWLGGVGHVEIAVEAEHCVRLSERVEQLASREYPAEFISRDEAAELLPGIRIPGDAELIAHFAREAFAYPALYIASALHRARSAGTTLISGKAVIGLAPSSDHGAEVELADGTTLDADVVVSAVGRWTSDLAALAGLHAPMQRFVSPGDVTVGYLLTTAPVPVMLDRIVTSPWLNLRPEGGGRLLLQALDLDDTSDPTEVPSIDSSLAAEFLRRLGDIAVGGEFAGIERLTVGQRAIPADGQTIAGRPSGAPWLYVVATHSGMTLAPFLGEAVADELAGGERAELASFRPDRFAADAVVAAPPAPRRPGQQ